MITSKEYGICNVMLTFIFFLSLFILPSPAFCESWECVGPSGGYFLGSVTNPVDASQVTVITNGPSNVYRSMDDGASWNKIGEIPVSSYILNDMCAFDFSTLFAITSNRCYRSTDGGVTWYSSSFPSSSTDVYHVCVDPVDDNKVYAAGRRYNSDNRTYSLQFFKSINGGQRWDTSSLYNNFDRFYPQDLAVSRSNPDVIYIVCTNFIFKSIDGGEQWRVVYADRNSSFRSIAVDPDDAENIYIRGRSCLYRSSGTGQGADFTLTQISIPFYALSLGFDPFDQSRIYAAGFNLDNRTGYSVGVSTDSGQSWTIHDDCIEGEPIKIEVARANPSTIYISTYNGLFKSTDWGNSWAVAHEGIHATRITALAVAPSDPSTVIVEYDDCGLMGTYNSGANWDYLGYFVGCGNVCDIIINPENADAVLALEGSG